MNPMRLKKKIDCETLHLPELRHLIGKVVDITVIEEDPLQRGSNEFWNPPTLDELARRQGIDPNLPTPPPKHTFTEAEFEGFDEWLREIRRGPWRDGSED
jgi:hypothetical protein